MNKKGSAAKITLNGYEELFGLEGQEEKIQEIPIVELYEFPGHPFQVQEDEAMQELAESIKEYGVLLPGIVRRRSEGRYEILSGHRRKHACELAGRSSMPVFIKEYSNEEATIIMVDSNLQREELLPSEKARAYSMKYEAMKHQGKKGKGNSLEEVGEAAGESGKTVQRYIWLSRLSEGLLEMVDRKKIGFVQGVALSFLTGQAQEWVQQIVIETNGSISTAQAAKLKEYGKRDELTLPMVRMILTEEKAKEKPILLRTEKLRSFFPENVSKEEIENCIYQLLEEWKRKQ
mgnify:CR=1 FL=1